MNRQETITKVKNPQGDFFPYGIFSLAHRQSEMFIYVYICFYMFFFSLIICFMIVELICLLISDPSFFCVSIWVKRLCCPFQFSKQVPSESSNVHRAAGAVPKSNWDLWTGVIILTGSFCLHMLSVWCDSRSLECTQWMYTVNVHIEVMHSRFDRRAQDIISIFALWLICYDYLDMTDNKVKKISAFQTWDDWKMIIYCRNCLQMTRWKWLFSQADSLSSVERHRIINDQYWNDL